MGYELVDVAAEDDWGANHALRREVLWRAKGRDGYDETHADEHVASNYPLLLKLNGQGIGTTRLDDFGNGTGAIRLVTIAPDLQRQGHGRVLSQHVEDYARRLGLRTLRVNATPEAVGYYKKMGWREGLWDASELVGAAADCIQMSKSVEA